MKWFRFFWKMMETFSPGLGGEEVSYHAEKQQSPLLRRTVMHTVVVIVMKY